jgi:tetratricopeptide (TPR) repeat protein
MMSRPYVCLLAFLLLLGMSSFAQQAPQSTDDPQQQPGDYSRGLDPNLKRPSEPPRSQPDENARRGEDSSSKDNPVDLSPPKNDRDHPGSMLDGPEPSEGVIETKQWNPHQADKDVEVGLYYFKRKNYIAAERRFRDALYWQDNHAEACYRLGRALEKLNQPDEARDYYRKYLKILPNGEFAPETKKALARLNSASESSKKAENKPISRP